MKPCPWCDTDLALQERAWGRSYYINCTSCGCVGPVAHSPAGARREWDARGSADGPRVEVVPEGPSTRNVVDILLDPPRLELEPIVTNGTEDKT